MRLTNAERTEAIDRLGNLLCGGDQRVEGAARAMLLITAAGMAMGYSGTLVSYTLVDLGFTGQKLVDLFEANGDLSQLIKDLMDAKLRLLVPELVAQAVEVQA